MFDCLTLAAEALDHHDVTRLFLALGVLLAMARILGEIAARYRQPTVLGELLAGVLLGPTLLGQIAPETFAYLFPDQGGATLALNGLITIAVAMLLLAAGLEVDLATALRQGKAAVLVSAAGVALPFAGGFGAAWLLPGVMGLGDPAMKLPFALFAGIAMSITALPVIAKILIDLKLLKSDMGMLIMSSAMINDLIGWIVFAVILAMMPGRGAAGDEANSVLPTILITIGFAVGMITLGRLVIHYILPFIQAHFSWPGGVLAFVFSIGLFCAAFTEYIGIHSIFGAFIAGVAAGDSRHLRERTRDTIHQFINNIFAPIFFASIGLYVNFITDFNIVTVLIVLAIACVGKFGGCYLGGRIGGLQPQAGKAVAFGMMAQGAMGIILGQLARQAGLIDNELFVAIVIMAILTSLVAGPLMQRALQLKVEQSLGDLLGERHFVQWIQGRTARDAIGELSQRAADITGLNSHEINNAVWRREQLMSTGLGNQIAVPHARLTTIEKPMIVIGRSEAGVDFNAADGRKARIVCLLLTPANDQAAQIELLRLVATTFGEQQARDAAIDAETYTEFLVAIKLSKEEAAPAHGTA